jgi:hypothetical protein
MSVKIKTQIEKISLGRGDTLSIRWTRDTGVRLYPDSDRTKWKDDGAVLVLRDNGNGKEGLHIFIKAGSKVVIHNLKNHNKIEI